MNDLAEFLLERIAEDQARVQSFAASEQFPNGMVVRKHWRTQLAECEAKRQIVELHDAEHHCIEDIAGTGTLTEAAAGSVTVDGLTLACCQTLRRLAVPYAEHPDYRQEWKP